MCGCCLGARSVSSWISYGLKLVIPWHFVLFLFVYISVCLPVHEKHEHFLVWEHFVSDHGSATALNRESLDIFLFLFDYINLCLPVH